MTVELPESSTLLLINQAETEPTWCVGLGIQRAEGR